MVVTGSISRLQVMIKNLRNCKVRECVVRSTKWSTAIFLGGGSKGGRGFFGWPR